MNGKTKVHVALIGAGGMGRRWADVLEKTNTVSVVAICDKDKKRAKFLAKRFPQAVISHDWNTVASLSFVDAAIVALPHNLLAGVSSVFLKQKKHVLCEKPGGMAPKEILKNIKIAERNNLCYMIGFNHRFHDGFLKAKNYFTRGLIGAPLFIRAQYGFGGRGGYGKEWRLSRKQGGGELLDQGVHMIDLVLWFLGDARDTRGFAKNLFWGGTGEDNAFVLLKSKKGPLASVHVSLSMWKANHVFEIYGTKGYLVVDGLGKKYPGNYGGGEKLLLGKRTGDFGAKEKIVFCNKDAGASLRREFLEFILAVKTKKPSRLSPRGAVKVLEIVKKIYAQN